MYVSEICAEGIFVTFPWWLKNVKSRSKIALFSNERHFEIWFPKKRAITFFWSKLSKLHKKDSNFACGNYIFPKTRGNKKKPWTHSTPLKSASLLILWCSKLMSLFQVIVSNKRFVVNRTVFIILFRSFKILTRQITLHLRILNYHSCYNNTSSSGSL